MLRFLDELLISSMDNNRLLGLIKKPGRKPQPASPGGMARQVAARREGLTGAAFGFLQGVAVLALEAVAGGEVGLAVVVLPDLVEARLARLAAQRALPQDAALLIAGHFDEARPLEPVETVGQDDQYLSFHIRLFAAHQHAEPLGLVGTRVGGEGPVGVALGLVPDSDVGAAILVPMVQGEEGLARVVVMHLH